MKLISILFFVFISFTIAQQYDYGGDDGGWNNQDYDNYGTGGAKQEGKNNAVGGYGYGWGKLLLAGVGGYITGATIHAGRAKKKSAPKLRFKLKQRVECNMGGTAWMKGTIIKLWSQPTKGQWFPYAIQLDDGQQTMAPADNDLTIRAA
ncbi:MAG: hypothetical protein ACI90V_006529 [Bacillariaceae sp.]|jgi:hypothetical protein